MKKLLYKLNMMGYTNIRQIAPNAYIAEMNGKYTLFIMLDKKVYKATISEKAIVSIGRSELPILGVEYYDDSDGNYTIELSNEDARRYFTCTLASLASLQQLVNDTHVVLGGFSLNGLILDDEL